MAIDKLQKQTNVNIQEKANLIWEIATHLYGEYKPHEYGKVILPMTVIKRFDDALKDTKKAVVEKANELNNSTKEVNDKTRQAILKVTANFSEDTVRQCEAWFNERSTYTSSDRHNRLFKIPPHNLRCVPLLKVSSEYLALSHKIG